MTNTELESFLFKATVLEIHLMSRKSKDPITIQESLERLQTPCDVRNLRFIRSFYVENFEYSFQLQLSSSLLKTNVPLTESFDLDRLAWIFSLPPYDCGVEEHELKDPDYSGPRELRPEEGAAEWLSRGILILENSSPRMQHASPIPLESLLLT